MPSPGTFAAKVTYIQMGITSTGKQQLGIRWALEDGESIWSYHWFSSEGAMKVTESTLQSIGWDPIVNGWALDQIVETDLLVGREAQLVLAEEEYDGKRRVRVQFVNDINGGGGMRDAMTPEQVAEFVAALRARAGAAPVPQAAPPSQPEKQYSDKDVPF